MCKLLGEFVEHHVKQEQNELFPKVKKTSIDLKELGQPLAEHKAELMEKMAQPA